MAGIILEGKVIAESIRASIRAEVEVLRKKISKTPRLVAVQIGESASSAVYVRSQARLAEELGIAYEIKTIPGNLSQNDVEQILVQLNGKSEVSAVILQLPVPKDIDAKKLLDKIAPGKDAEGMNPYNLGKLFSGHFDVAPCTALAIMELIRSTNVELYGKEVVVVGHSEIVGKPLAMLLLTKFATTTVCHIATGERGLLRDNVARAEVLVVAVGKPNLIRGDWIKPGAIVLDVGINKVGDKIVGDVEFESARNKASFITPVPGGVGPLTTTMLMRNVLALFKKQISA
ncbi:MAG: bifunctional 5,10-methylenetetrahydrofolate dehydrogenase/5,10-methenyltetrahydrofolate cyclohydrolase [Candidatus Omnitrophica bacterium]|nr:bifunctional 5,10-methylenetetrahydrofolate dehydrogenase/5,10-methenyltetrahydrofolate cyclohydrolase [Candidatus Omnitrophota bacterium]